MAELVAEILVPIRERLGMDVPVSAADDDIPF